jgi:hypothetical protein
MSLPEKQGDTCQSYWAYDEHNMEKEQVSTVEGTSHQGGKEGEKI